MSKPSLTSLNSRLIQASLICINRNIPTYLLTLLCNIFQQFYLFVWIETIQAGGQPYLLDTSPYEVGEPYSMVLIYDFDPAST